MTNSYQGQGRQAIKVVKLLMQESGSYNAMQSRPYQTHVDQTTLDNITRRVEESRGATVTGTLLSGIAGNILTPSATPQGEIAIPYGWAERRIRFSMEVHVIANTGSVIIYYFQGYTSHLGVSQSGAVDPKMEFILNSFIRVTRTQQYGPNGMQVRDIVTESANIINGQIQYQQQNQGNSDIFMMRPQDVFTGIQSGYIEDAYSYYNGADAGINDTRIKLNGESVRSNRTNNLPANYIANIVDNYQTGVKLAEFGQSDSDIISRCRELAYEAPIYENVFIRAIASVRGIPNVTSFTLGDLEKIDPDVSSVTNYITLGAVRQNQMHQAGQTAYWTGSDRETLVATILSNAVPSVMMELMISKILFRSTNHDMTGAMNTVIIGAKSLTNADLTTNFELFKKRLEREIIYDITFGNQESYSLEMDADLFGETTITISLASGPVVSYTTPSFCDSLTAPIITGNKENFFNVVHDFEQLMNNVNGVSKEMHAVNTTI